METATTAKQSVRVWCHALSPTRLFRAGADHLALTAVLTFGVSLFVDKFATSLHSMLSMDGNGIISLLATSAQILATILGFLVALYILKIQSVEQSREASYRTYRSQIGQLLELVGNAPSRLEGIRESLTEFIKEYGFRRLEALPEFRQDFDDVHPMTVSAMKFSDTAGILYQQVCGSDRIYLQRIILAFDDVEDSMNQMVTQYIAIIVAGIIRDSIRRLAALLLSSLTLLAAFSIHDATMVLSQASTPLLVTFFVCMLLTMIDLVFHIGMIYRDLHGPWEFPDNV